MGSVVRTCAVGALFLQLLTMSCQDTYPLAPTPCDDWCEATKELECGYHDPARCVMQCELTGMSTKPECADQFAAALACYQDATIPCDEDDEYFFYPGPYPC